MNILTYSAEHEDFRRRLHAFCDEEIIPFADQWETDHALPRDIWRKAGRAGFLCPGVAKRYGGLGGDFRYALIVNEEMARTGQTGLAASLHSDVVVPYIESFGSEAQKQRYLPGCVNGDIVTAVAMTEPDAGSDLAAMTTTAVEEGDTVVINGAKTFISNGLVCDLVVLAARDPAVEDRYQAISLYLVETGTPGFHKGRRLDKMGWHSQDTAELFFTDCRIPVENRLGDKGAGFLMLMTKLQQERLTCALGALTAAERILEWTTGYCRRTAMDGRLLVKNQTIQFALVEMATETKIGRAFVEKLVADHIQGGQIIVETAMAKFWTTDLANRTANRCMELLGEAGNLEHHPIARGLRDARVMAIFAGTNEIMKQIAAKFMGL
ncbi:MAG: acyl-CoA dehydrogenase family protein [Desulfobacteraceae bacterium]|nr:acyl-CoA dehydrogenase family protein [Desulfobacteraceae bacterium]